MLKKDFLLKNPTGTQKRFDYLAVIFLIVFCSVNCKNEQPVPLIPAVQPTVYDNGEHIIIPHNYSDSSLFQTKAVDRAITHQQLLCPARVFLCASQSTSAPGSPLFLFDSPDETSLYSSFRQNLAIYDRAKRTYERIQDLYSHQSASGKEVGDANSDLSTATAALAETEGKLRALGIEPELFLNAKPGMTWIISDVPESGLHYIKKGGKTKVLFPSYPGDTFTATTEAIGEVIDNATRTVKVRLSIFNNNGRFKPGMYAEVKFETTLETLVIPKMALFSANAKYFVFVKKSDVLYERRDVSIETENPVSYGILNGLQKGDSVVISNVYLLKGLSLGI